MITRAHRGISDGAREVVNNVLALRQAVSALTGDSQCVRPGRQRSPSRVDGGDRNRTKAPANYGKFRTGWVAMPMAPTGQSTFHPTPEAVEELMADLAAFLSEDRPLPLVQAALVHAQVRDDPSLYADGNGQNCGRVLIHTVLARQGLAVGHVLPHLDVTSCSRSGVHRWVERLPLPPLGEQDSPAAIAGRERLDPDLPRGVPAMR